MSYENILELLESLPAEQADFKAKLKGFVTTLNQDKGKASADILKFKDQLDKLKAQADETKEKTAGYKEIAEALAKAGVDAKNTDELLDKLNLKKSTEEENAILKKALDEAKEQLGGFETKEQLAARKEKVTPLFGKALEDFVKAKQTDGKADYRLSDEFVNKEELYKEIDIDNDTLKNEHFTKVLQAADVKQQKFIESTGMGYVKDVHNTNLNQGHYQNTDGIKTVASDAINEARKSGGSIENIANGIAQLHAAQKKES